MPLHRRIPKRGFHNPFPKEFAILNNALKCSTRFSAGETLCRQNPWRRAASCVRANRPVKILGDGHLKTALTVQAHAFSKTAEEKITRAGGKVEKLL